MNPDCLSAHNAVWWFTLLAALIVILGFVVTSLRKEVKKMSKAFDGLKVSITALEATVAEAVAKLGTSPVPPTDAPTEAEITAEAGRVDKLNTDLQAVLHPPPPPPPPAGAPNTAASAGGPGSGFLVNE